ncbi:hypothetical protein pqer_cds_225 [Pandoravirus quercus]|uniref:Uncharacterized protein n=2 Tax=Pandoravirus TaxID=2060084 RepID=A0A2U7U893_9VIRU|nr:hypothetical protein pqer_cds_225 [Pandoravirus quercus]AVK74647.1 hypothetical protein pqer_cds_225 [Pandoravirus quercus]QBZ80825.1 hypothetical protein pclt_cds_227 [Pandoravirus celtis]
MNVISALVAAAPQLFCDALGRVPSCEAGVRRAFVVGLCGCALLALWTVNRHRNRSALSRRPHEDAYHAIGAVDDDADDALVPQTVYGDDDDAPENRDGAQVQRHWTESMSEDSESSADLHENSAGDGDDDDNDDEEEEDMRACRRWAKAHKDHILSAAHEADAMLKARMNAENNALLLDEKKHGDNDDGVIVARRRGPESTVAMQSPPDNSAEILENGNDGGDDDGHVADEGGRVALSEHDVAGRPDDTMAQEAPCDGGALVVTDGILARWSAQGLSVHASWAPAYADTCP